METKKGNEVSKKGEPENPALYIERAEHDVVKKASEVQIDEKGDVHNETHIQPDDKKEENGEPQTGDKRAADETAEEKKTAEGNDAKKQKTNGEKPKKKGRPAKGSANGSAAKKDTKKRPPKKAATESGEPRRSGRNASKS